MKSKKNNIPDINLNLNVRGLPPSATLAINELSTQLRREGKHIYKLGLGQSPFPVPRPVVEQFSPSKPPDESFLETYTHNTISAIDLLVSWIHDYFDG